MPEIIKRPDPKRKQKLEAFDRLLTIMDELRDNCPWDKKQTLESLRHLTIEEVNELADAIVENDVQEIKKEVGDILLHLVFYARIASETNDWDVDDMINALCDKMVHRHPHIYSDVKVENEEDVKRNWEQIKLKEKKGKRVLEGVPVSLPAMVKSYRIQSKARGVGFDWDNKKDVWAKVEEELGEFQEATGKEEQEAEFGDLIFSLINYARFVDIDPEQALEKTNKKFIQRFNYLEDRVNESGKRLENMSLPEMEHYWNEAKNLEE